MPRVFGNKYRSALLKRVTHIVQDENSVALQNVEGFVHMEMSMDGDTCTNHHLLCTQGEIVRTRGGANLNEDVPVVAKMNEMFTFSCANHISLRESSTDLPDGSSYSGCACSLQKTATAMFDVHGSLPKVPGHSTLPTWLGCENGREPDESAVSRTMSAAPALTTRNTRESVSGREEAL